MMLAFLVLVASRSQVTSEQQMIDKPGRSIITFLLILNLALWIASTFGLKHAVKFEIHRTHYSDIAWKIITHLSLPLIIFFRFHSTICLADVWLNAYRMGSHEVANIELNHIRVEKGEWENFRLAFATDGGIGVVDYYQGICLVCVAIPELEGWFHCAYNYAYATLFNS
ncbi:unnamed protein product [Rodentolepis nana]|uniref:DUF1980 domain-containing protein n=1 Tax=Rodentolepis nana TaxID=102285 RepID=A0A0R3U0K9_RODNA|nr:unnamed protein product [Rodentolepis nana]